MQKWYIPYTLLCSFVFSLSFFQKNGSQENFFPSTQEDTSFFLMVLSFLTAFYWLGIKILFIPSHNHKQYPKAKFS